MEGRDSGAGHIVVGGYGGGRIAGFEKGLDAGVAGCGTERLGFGFVGPRKMRKERGDGGGGGGEALQLRH